MQMRISRAGVEEGLADKAAIALSPGENPECRMQMRISRAGAKEGLADEAAIALSPGPEGSEGYDGF